MLFAMNMTRPALRALSISRVVGRRAARSRLRWFRMRAQASFLTSASSSGGIVVASGLPPQGTTTASKGQTPRRHKAARRLPLLLPSGGFLCNEWRYAKSSPGGACSRDLQPPLPLPDATPELGDDLRHDLPPPRVRPSPLKSTANASAWARSSGEAGARRSSRPSAAQCWRRAERETRNYGAAAYFP